jgi:hypothetical protein
MMSSHGVITHAMAMDIGMFCSQNWDCNYGKVSESSGSHGGEYEDDSLLVWAPSMFVEIERQLMTEAVRTSETSVSF